MRNFPKRDELSFRMVRAFPKDSRIGDDSSTLCSRFSSGAADLRARYLSYETTRMVMTMSAEYKINRYIQTSAADVPRLWIMPSKGLSLMYTHWAFPHHTVVVTYIYMFPVIINGNKT